MRTLLFKVSNWNLIHDPASVHLLTDLFRAFRLLPEPCLELEGETCVWLVKSTTDMREMDNILLSLEVESVEDKQQPRIRFPRNILDLYLQ